MANFKDSPHFAVHDDYYTPKIAWEKISHLIPKNIIILEACMLNASQSKSPEYLKELLPTCVVRSDTQLDILKDYVPCSMIITNIPFSTELKKQILTRFVEIDKPFITLLNSCNLYSNYFKEIFKDKFDEVQIIHPQGKINYDKLEDGVLKPTKNCSFYSVYLCYKMKIPNKDLYL